MIEVYNPEAVRAFSACLFGARYRLEVCAALHSGEVITATALSERLAIANLNPSKASLGMELQKLRDAGLLSLEPKQPGDRHTYLVVRHSDIWTAARKLVQESLEQVASV